MNSSNGNQSDSREDDFGEMLRSAGRGPRLSDEARARIRESVEATWQDAVGRGSHSRSPDAGKPRRGTVSIGSQARR
ncbi:MAG TPA: hypothetical protein VKQ06_08865, partial [Gammaproteobacteria bacterium]|nr:hypothetical protein [Gammaproteobacteria bacterium]